LALIVSLVWAITACNRKDDGTPNRRNDGVFPSNPQAVGSSEMNLIPPHIRNSFFASATTYLTKNPGFLSGVKANVVPDQRGTNLLLQGRVLFYDGGPFVEVDPTAEFWDNCGNYYCNLMIYLPEVKEINRLFAITNLETQQFDVWGYKVFEDGSYESQGVFAHGTYGPIIDIERQTPMFANYLVIEIFPPIRPPFLFGIRELGLYGPQPLQIASPTSQGPFIFGEMIHFVGSQTGIITNISWESNLDGVMGLGLNVDFDHLRVGKHTITLKGKDQSTGQWASDSKTIEIFPPKIEIINLDGSSEVSYRKAKTKFKSIGRKPNNSIVDPYSVDWGLEGGTVGATEQLRMGILNQLGTLNTHIGNLDGFATISNSSTVTFNSFLPGNITITAKKGTASATVAVRIKQPTFKVKVYPVEGIDVSGIFEVWKTTAEAVWNKEDIMHVESIELMSALSNVTYPNSPLSSPPQGAEEFVLSDLYEYPSYLNPLVYDCLLGQNSGLFIIPRQSSSLFFQRHLASINVYVTKKTLSYFEDQLVSPPEKKWRFPNVYAISSRDYFTGLERSGVVLKNPTPPLLSQHQKYLAQGIGRIFGLPQYADWLTNLMDFGPNGGLEMTPLQYISALNYNGDNPQSSFFISEQ